MTAGFFLAEVRDLSKYDHYKQIQKLAGLNLRLNDSGRGHGRHKINKIGNRRLRWVVYMMTKETIKYTPEVRIKYLKRQMKRYNYTKNIIACSGQLLQLIMALIKDNRCYEHFSENQSLVWELEYHYEIIKKDRNSKKKIPVSVPLTV